MKALAIGSGPLEGRWARGVAPFVLIALVLTGFGCAPRSGQPPAGIEPAEGPGPPGIDHLALAQAAVTRDGRPEADLVDDAGRKPDQVIAFFQIEPGMRVLDLLSGSGYYTELLASIVGDDGEVIAHNNQAYLSRFENLEERFVEGRLANVTRLQIELPELRLEPESLDVVVFVLGYHTIWLQPIEGGWPEISHETLLGTLYDALEPGGVLGIVDHSALSGAELAKTSNELYRVDEGVVREQVEAAGFVLEAESDVLRSPADDRTLLVFDPSIRRQSDRFVYRFRKP